MAQAFGPQRPINTDAAVDTRDDSTPSVAAVETGTWVAVWSADVGGDFDILMARSLDAGETWSNPRPLDPDAASDGLHDQAAEVAGDGRGNWVAVWEHWPAPAQNVIVVARSSDDGATWTAPAPIRGGPITSDTFPHIATDHAGTWLVVWGSYEGSAGFRIHAARAMDAGATWSPTVLVHASPTAVLGLPRAASNSGGRWIVAWESTDGIEVARSGDNGTTWSAPVLVHKNDTESNGEFPDVAGNGNGTFVVVWSLTPVAYPHAPPPDVDPGVLATRSADGGVTWSPAERLSVPGRGGGFPAIAADEHANWAVIWEGSFGRRRLAGDGIVARWSHDDAATWDAPKAVNGAADDHAFDGTPRIATDGRGRWIASWYSWEQHPGTDEGDFDAVSVHLSCGCPLCEACDASGACIAVPRDRCPHVAAGADSMIALHKTNGNRLKWRLHGIAQRIDGDPRFDTDVGLCVYGPTGKLFLRATAPAGLACHERPCWSGGSRTGWVYRNQAGEHDGVVALKARAKSQRFSVRARGASLVLPSLPASLPLTVQLQTGRGTCSETGYDAAAVLENTPTRFVARDRRATGGGAPGR